MVLIWSFRALKVESDQEGEPRADRKHGWGAITLFRFDRFGKIVAEIGGERAPGPLERLAKSSIAK